MLSIEKRNSLPSLIMYSSQNQELVEIVCTKGFAFLNSKTQYVGA
jgi:hypothetical protein